jgi:hypothetical protein
MIINVMAMNWIKRIIGANASDGAERPEGTPIREAPPPAPLIDADETLVGEFTRARRYEQTLTIVVVSAAPRHEAANGKAADSNGNGARGPDVLPLLAAVGLREALRESDVVCYRPMEGRFVLGLPQSDDDEARKAMARVGELFYRRLHIELMAGAASFPDDGLTLEDLEHKALERAEGVWPEARSPASGDMRPPREVPSHRAHPRPRARPPRASSSSEIAREAGGVE